MNINELSSEIINFYHQWDPYEYHDNYESYDEAEIDALEILNSKSKTSELIYNLKEINKDLSNDNDKDIQYLYRKSGDLIRNLETYYKSLSENLVL